MSLYKSFAVDSASSEHGKWFEVAPGVKFKIRRFKSKASQDVRAQLEKPYQTMLKQGPLSAEINEEMLIKQLALSIIVDWSGVTDERDEVIPFSADTAYVLMKDARLVELRDAIIQIALSADQFKDAENQATLKN